MANGIRDKLKANLDAVEARIVQACQRAGRRREDVTLVTVTKTVSSEVADIAVDLGLRDLAENRPQELWRKADHVAGATWHLIGHLQRNKIERTLPLVQLIHSVDSERLLHALESEATSDVSVMLEVNASGETSKQGFAPADVLALVPRLLDLRRVSIRGLMTMAAYQEPAACRPTFAMLRLLRDQLRNALTPSHEVRFLSMGMSNDFEIAIEEGATHIRLGTVLFEGVTS